MNETLNVTPPNERISGSNQRRPKLTAGFAQDLGLLPEQDPESKTLLENDLPFNRLHKLDNDESSRGLSPESIAKITETLGAINTVGRYLVNYTKGAASPTDFFIHENQQASPVSNKK